MAALDGAAPRRYLLRFICEAHTANFRYAELDALLSARGLDPRVVVAARDRAATEPGFRPVATQQSTCCRARCSAWRLSRGTA